MEDKKEKRENVLFSLIGSTDPIRNSHDGPMLHIVRNFSPQKVYLLFTAEMEDRDQEDGRNEKAIYSVDPKIEIIKIFSDIRDVHHFDIYYPKISESIERIRRENPEDIQILANITSGPPQFIAALALYISSFGTDIMPVQVITPDRSANHSPTIQKEGYDIESEIKENCDAKKNTKRCICDPNLFHFQKVLHKEQLISLIQKYEYPSAKAIFNKNFFPNYQKITNLLNFGLKRMELNIEEANKQLLDPFYKKELFQKGDEKNKYVELQNYYVLLKLKTEKGDYNSALLMLEPFIQEMEMEFVHHILKIPKKIFLKGKYTNYGEMAQSRPALFEYFKKKYSPQKLENLKNGKERSPLLNPAYLLTIIEYCEVEEKNALAKEAVRIFKLYDKIKDDRNISAHNLVIKTKEELQKALGLSITDYLENIKKLLVKMYPREAKEKHFQMYETINRFLIEEFNR